VIAGRAGFDHFPLISFSVTPLPNDPPSCKVFPLSKTFAFDHYSFRPFNRSLGSYILSNTFPLFFLRLLYALFSCSRQLLDERLPPPLTFSWILLVETEYVLVANSSTPIPPVLCLSHFPSRPAPSCLVGPPLAVIPFLVFIIRSGESDPNYDHSLLSFSPLSSQLHLEGLTGVLYCVPKKVS